MKILFVSAVLPYPLYSGGQIRIYQLLKRLSKDHEITLISFIRTEGEKKYLPQLSFLKEVRTVMRGRAWQPRYVVKSVFGAYPFLWESYHNSEMLSMLTDELSKSYDVVHLEPGYVWPSLPATNTPVVVSEHNIEHTIYEDFVGHFPFMPLRPLLSLDVVKMKFWEKRIWREANRVVAVSHDDQRVIEDMSDRRDVAVVPNGVDLATFKYKPKKMHPSTPTFLFVGNFSWIQNRDAVSYLVRQIWPHIKAKYPLGSLRVVGRGANGELRGLLARSGIEVLDHVDDIHEEFARADMLLAPIRIGGGTKFKILEAMASGVPVVTTTVGILGLRVTNGRELWVGNNPASFVDRIETIVSNAPACTAMVKLARTCIEDYYSWDHIAGKLDTLWQEAHHGSR